MFLDLDITATIHTPTLQIFDRSSDTISWTFPFNQHLLLTDLQGGGGRSLRDCEGGVEGGGRVGTAHHLPHLLQAGQRQLRMDLFYVDF